MRTIRDAIAAHAEPLDSVFWNWLATGGGTPKVRAIAEGLMEKHAQDLGEAVQFRMDLIRSFGGMHEYVRFADKPHNVSDLLQSFAASGGASSDEEDTESVVDDLPKEEADAQANNEKNIYVEPTALEGVPLPLLPETTDDIAADMDTIVPSAVPLPLLPDEESPVEPPQVHTDDIKMVHISPTAVTEESHDEPQQEDAIPPQFS